MLRYPTIIKLCITLLATVICLGNCWAQTADEDDESEYDFLDTVYPAWETQTKRYVRISGSDTNNGQTPGTAWRSLRHALSQIGPGITLFIGAGTYEESDMCLLNAASGSASNRTVILADTSGAKTGDAGPVVMRAFANRNQWLIRFQNCRYVIFAGVDFEENPNVTNLPDHSTVSDDASYGAWNTAMQQPNLYWPHGIHIATSTWVRLYDCTFKGYRHGVHDTDGTQTILTRCDFYNPRYMGVYAWNTNRFHLGSCKFYFTDMNKATYNHVFGTYFWNSYMTVSGCRYYGAGNWKEASKLSGRQQRIMYQLHGNGVGNDKNNYTSNRGRLNVTNTHFFDSNHHALYMAWIRLGVLNNNRFNDCRYGLHAHGEDLQITNTTFTRPTNSTWNATSDTWTDSWAMYVNCFSAPTNRNLDPNWRKDIANPRILVKNITFTNQHRSLLVGSDNITLDTIAFNGNCQFENNDRRTGRWLCYSQAIETGWHCTNMEYNDTQNLTFTNQWWCILNTHGYDCKTTFRNLNIQDNWNGIHCNGTRAEYINCNISNNKEHGVHNWWMLEVIATNSQFNNNASTDWSGWGFIACGQMTPRTPQTDPPIPNWDWTTEYDAFGTYGSTIRIQNCQANDNGQYRVGGSGGFWIGRVHQNNLTLSGNEAKNNHAYGVYFFNTEVTLNNNSEFTEITGNWHGLHFDGVMQNQRGTYVVNNYDISNNYHGVLLNWGYCELNNVRSHHNEQYGIYAHHGKVKYRNVTADFNTQGFMMNLNTEHDIRNINGCDNSQHGYWCRLTEAWPATPAYTRYRPVLTYDVQDVTTNRNLYGYSIYSIEWDVQTSTDSDGNNSYAIREIPGNMNYKIKNLTCNNNRHRGLWVAYGWLDTSLAPLNINCLENGFLDTNGNKNGNGIEFYNPKRDIVLTSSLGINAHSSVANTAIYAWNHNWAWNQTAGANRMSTPNVKFVVDGWNCSGDGNPNWTTACDAFWDVEIKNQNTKGGHWINNCQGDVLCKDSTVTDGYRGISFHWGSYEGRTDFEAPIQTPRSFLMENCTLLNAMHQNFYCDAWTNWTLDNKRITLTIRDSNFHNSRYDGFLIYNNDAVIENCTADGNGRHAMYVWGGNATLRNCTASDNAAGRVNDSNGNPQDVGWNAIYLGYPWTPTNNYPDKRYTYLVENCTINNTEGYGLFIDNLYGAATVLNTLVNNCTTGGTGIDFRQLQTATATNCTVTGVTGNHGFLAYFVDNVNYVNCTSIGNVHGISAYGKHEQLNNVWIPSNPDATATFTNCVARDGINGGHAMISGYNSPTVRGCQMLRHPAYGLLCHNNINGTIENNLCQNNGQVGLRLDASGTGVIRNNVVTRNAHGIGMWECPTGNIKVWNNTVANNTNWGLYAQRATTVDLENNIFASNGTWGAYFEANSTVTIANNLMNTHTSADYRHPNRTLSELRSPTDVTKPPRFVDPANGDYRLGKGSPAINAGTPATDFATDLIGQARGTYRAWEIGAYEYTAPDGSLRVLNWGEKK